MNNPIYNLIYALGTLVTNLVTGAIRFYKRYILFGIKNTIAKIIIYNKDSFKSAKTFIVRAVVFLLIASIITGVAVIANKTSTKVSATEVIFDGETVGYIQNEEDAEKIKANTLKKLNTNKDFEIKLKNTKTEAYNIISNDELSDNLVKVIAPDYIKVCEVYIDDNLICAVNDQMAAHNAINSVLEAAKKEFPKASVSFSEKITYKYAYYKSSDENIWTGDRLALAIRTFELLTPQHVECETKISTVDYETVDIETNTLFIGDSRVRRKGEKGSEYVIDLVTYIDNKKVLSQNLTSLSIKDPVSQVIERGMRAESISMGGYTVTQTSGYFCWPVVGLHTVTSPFGWRSLGNHKGIDISGANASGSLVVAGASGVVTEAGWSTGGYGNYVMIDHGNGVETLYAHMLDNSLMVSVGDHVTKGYAIGRVGNTGYSFGAHLHFEVRINGTRVNPAWYIGLE
ncbi:MAG: hypothetical protein E7557_09135 [Ruminococcaceae bacterium]|nr:hypothetical protein [Oscillospiraceae bacterium]